jgi:YesN/AraC family two-component response regulator
MKIYIRNMACESCKVVVREALVKVNLSPLKVDLGEAEFKGKMTAGKEKQFNETIKKVGLQLVKSKEGILADQIKAAISDYVNNIQRIKGRLSDYLSKKLHHDYNYLSGYFSSMNAGTIEQYMIALKIEKAKEYLVLDDLTLSEIADKLNYSSVAHLSTQFKKVTGLPASYFKKLGIVRRKTMQEL